jgi:hypothetical protein
VGREGEGVGREREWGGGGEGRGGRCGENELAVWKKTVIKFLIIVATRYTGHPMQPLQLLWGVERYR